MLVEPTLERAAVAEALKREYGRAVSAIQFVPVGETAWCYSATYDQGERWFVKLARPGELVPARVEFAVTVSRALADLGLPVPRPLPTLAGWASPLPGPTRERRHGRWAGAGGAGAGVAAASSSAREAGAPAGAR